MNLRPSSLQQLLNFFLTVSRSITYSNLSQPNLAKIGTINKRSESRHFLPHRTTVRTFLYTTFPGRVRAFVRSFALRSHASFFLIILVSVACSKPLPTFENLEIDKWKEDKSACGNIRKSGMAELTKQKDKLKGLSQGDIVELLGRPDQNELYKRNQKFFYYLLTPGKECGSDSVAHRLSLRFNAMGFAKEVLVE